MIRKILILILSLYFSKQLISQKFKGYLWGDTLTYIVYTNSLSYLPPKVLDSIIGDSPTNYDWVLFFPDDTTKYYKRPDKEWLDQCCSTSSSEKIKKSGSIDNGKLISFEYALQEYYSIYTVDVKKGKSHGQYMEYFFIYPDDSIKLHEIGFFYKDKIDGVTIILDSDYPSFHYWKKGKPIYGYWFYNNGNKEMYFSKKECKRWSEDGSLIFYQTLNRKGVKEIIIPMKSTE